LSAALQAQSSPSGWYELLRFGRTLGSDPLPPGAEHWRQIQTPAGARWANLNAKGAVALSDGDFPAFRGWQCINDDTNTGDQRCDSPALRSLLALQFDDKTKREKALAKTLEGRQLLATQAISPKTEDFKAKLRKLICQFSCEFDKSNIDARYAHVRQEPHFQDKPQNWTDLRAHIEALCTTLPAEFKAADWHFHPMAFVNHMRRCGWLDAATLRRIYSDTPEATIQKYIPDLNRVTRKYGFNTPNRLPHFIGQGGVESAYMKTMIEWAQTVFYKDGKPYGGPVIADSKKEESAFGHWWGTLASERVDWYGNRKYNSKGVGSGAPYDWNSNLGNLGAPDGQKFRGRGFKQLTGRANYSKYWLYRGWLQASSFDDNWWDDPQYKAKNESKMKKRPAPVNDPERISINTLNCLDTGGWFMTFRQSGVIKAMDTSNQGVDALIKDVTEAINGGANGLDDRKICTKKAMGILT
jgi:hydroxyethylthiazole kinase